MSIVFLFLFYLLVPMLLIYLCQKFSWLNVFGVVGLCYLSGLLVSLYLDTAGMVGLTKIELLEFKQENILGPLIAIALPLLVFSFDVKSVRILSGKILHTFVFGVFAVIVIAVMSSFLFENLFGEESHKAVGMAVGTYIGGGPNGLAVAQSLNATPTLISVFVAYDIALSAIYLVFAVFLAQPILKYFLPSYKIGTYSSEGETIEVVDEIKSYNKILNIKTVSWTFLAVLLSGLIVVFSLFGSEYLDEISTVIDKEAANIILLLSIVTLGIVASLVPFIRNLANTFEMGMYLVLCFCFVMGTMLDLEQLKEVNMNLLLFMSLIVFGSFALMILFARVFKVDVDTLIVTATAMYMSLPFVPLIAQSLKNKEILVPGLTLSILGYIVGSYAGAFSSWLVGFLSGI